MQDFAGQFFKVSRRFIASAGFKGLLTILVTNLGPFSQSGAKTQSCEGTPCSSTRRVQSGRGVRNMFQGGNYVKQLG